MQIISRRKYAFVFSGLLVAVSLVLFLIWGLKLGIDFTGGALMEVDLKKTELSQEAARQTLNELGIEGLAIQFSSEGTALARFYTDGDEKNL